PRTNGLAIVNGFRKKLEGHDRLTGIDVNNLEAVLNALEMQRFTEFQMRAQAGGGASLALKFLHQLIAWRLETQDAQWKAFGDADAGGVREYRCSGPKGYVELVSLVDSTRRMHPDQTVDLITFNYDVGLELAMIAAGHLVNYRLDGLPPEATRPGYSVFKLHG